MRIAYVGSFGQPWHTESYVASALADLGHDVIRLEAARPTDIEAAAAGCALLLMQGSQLHGPDVVPMFRRLEAAGTVTAGYHLDLFRGLGREDRVESEPFWRMQHVFTADGDPGTAQWLADRSVNHHWLPAAIGRDDAVEGFWDPSLSTPVLFVGSRHYHPEHPWRKKLLQVLERDYPARHRVVSGNEVRGRALSDLYASAQVVVGDSLALPGRRNYWSDRYYETVGRAGFLIAPWVEGIDDHFTDGLHCRFYDLGDVEGLRKLIDWYLEDGRQQIRREIASCGQAHVRERHTYHDRAAELLRTVGLA